MPLTAVRVTRTYVGATSGTVTCTLSVELDSPLEGLVYPVVPVRCTIDPAGRLLGPDGHLGVLLTATDDPAGTPQGARWIILEKVTGARNHRFSVPIPYDAPVDLTTGERTIDLAALTPVPDSDLVYVAVPGPEGPPGGVTGLAATAPLHLAGETLSLDTSVFDPAGAAGSAQSAAVASSAQKAANLSDLASAPAARTALGLGTAATHPDTDYEHAANRGAAGGYASLDGAGKVPSGQLPALAFNTVWPNVVSQAAMLALAAEPGDVAVRTDVAANFMLAALPASTLGNWAQLADATSPVTSVAGRTGAVSLAEADVAGLTGDLAAKLAAANNLADLVSASAARTSLGLGSAATHPATDFVPYVAGLVADNGASLTVAQANYAILSALTPGRYRIRGATSYYAVSQDLNLSNSGVFLEGDGPWKVKNPGSAIPAAGTLFGSNLGPCAGGTYTTAVLILGGNTDELDSVGVFGFGGTEAGGIVAPRAIFLNAVGCRLRNVLGWGADLAVADVANVGNGAQDCDFTNSTFINNLANKGTVLTVTAATATTLTVASTAGLAQGMGINASDGSIAPWTYIASIAGLVLTVASPLTATPVVNTAVTVAIANTRWFTVPGCTTTNGSAQIILPDANTIASIKVGMSANSGATGVPGSLTVTAVNPTGSQVATVAAAASGTVTQITIQPAPAAIPAGRVTLAGGAGTDRVTVAGKQAVGVLSAGLTAGATTSLPVNALGFTVGAGTITVSAISGGVTYTRNFTTGGAAAGATAIPVTSTTLSAAEAAAYITGTSVTSAGVLPGSTLLQVNSVTLAHTYANGDTVSTPDNTVTVSATISGTSSAALIDFMGGMTLRLGGSSDCIVRGVRTLSGTCVIGGSNTQIANTHHSSVSVANGTAPPNLIVHSNQGLMFSGSCSIDSGTPTAGQLRRDGGTVMVGDTRFMNGCSFPASGGGTPTAFPAILDNGSDGKGIGVGDCHVPSIGSDGYSYFVLFGASATPAACSIQSVTAGSGTIQNLNGTGTGNVYTGGTPGVFRGFVVNGVLQTENPSSAAFTGGALTSQLQVNGGIGFAPTRVTTATYQAKASDSRILGEGSAAQTIWLPGAGNATMAGYQPVGATQELSVINPQVGLVTVNAAMQVGTLDAAAAVAGGATYTSVVIDVAASGLIPAPNTGAASITINDGDHIVLQNGTTFSTVVAAGNAGGVTTIAAGGSATLNVLTQGGGTPTAPAGGFPAGTLIWVGASIDGPPSVNIAQHQSVTLLWDQSTNNFSWRFKDRTMSAFGGSGLFAVGGRINTNDATGAERNVLDDGAGNMTVAGLITASKLIANATGTPLRLAGRGPNGPTSAGNSYTTGTAPTNPAYTGSFVANDTVVDLQTPGLWYTPGGGTAPTDWVNALALLAPKASPTLTGTTTVTRVAHGVNAFNQGAGAYNIDASLGDIQLITLTGNAGAATIINPVVGQELTIEWKQDGTGGRTYTLPASVILLGQAWAASTAAGARDVLTVRWNGSNWVEIGRGQNATPTTLPTVTAGNPADPATTASTTLVMAGLGITYTPTASTSLVIEIDGMAGTAAASTTEQLVGKWGTGTAPANGAALTGTSFPQGTYTLQAAGTAIHGYFRMKAKITGLTIGVTYWFDLAFNTNNASDAAGLARLSYQVMEVA